MAATVDKVCDIPGDDERHYRCDCGYDNYQSGPILEKCPDCGEAFQPETFQIWWSRNKVGVCHDICHAFKLDINLPLHEAQLMHLVCQGWVAGEMAAQAEVKRLKAALNAASQLIYADELKEAAAIIAAAKG
jgi:hypothetical protein